LGIIPTFSFRISIVNVQPKVATKSAPLHAVILAHPEGDSFNAAVAQAYCQTVQDLGHRVVLRDLYRLGFNPVLKAQEQPQSSKSILSDDVASELVAIEKADIFVLIYPIWFSAPPAILKGYVDRVFGTGFSYGAIRKRDRHRFMTGKQLLSITTSGNSLQWLDEQGAWLSLRTVFGQYLAKAFSMAASEHLHLASIVENMSERHVKEELFRVTEMAREMCGRLEAEYPTNKPSAAIC
jgi:NAD(P)H dehydrogenase (quinone)